MSPDEKLISLFFTFPFTFYSKRSLHNIQSGFMLTLYKKVPLLYFSDKISFFDNFHKLFSSQRNPIIAHLQRITASLIVLVPFLAWITNSQKLPSKFHYYSSINASLNQQFFIFSLHSPISPSLPLLLPCVSFRTQFLKYKKVLINASSMFLSRESKYVA